MPLFEFSGRDSQGHLITGRRTAISANELADGLFAENIVPIMICETSLVETKSSFKRWFRRVPIEELELFCRQMYTLLKAGIPITMALQRLAETNKHVYFVEVLKGIIDQLHQGHSLVFALSQYPRVFSELFISVIGIGEESGRLELVFLKLSEYISLEEQTKKKMLAALRYPLIVLVTLAMALVIINLFVIPNFAKIFNHYQGELPIFTQILLGVSSFFTLHWHYLLLGIGIVGLMTHYFLQTEAGKLWWHRLLLKLPLVGTLIYKLYLARFCRLFALVLRSGISALEGMILVAKATGNAFLAAKVEQITANVARGTTISNACYQTGLFSNLVIQMLVVGEETGKMDDMLDEVGEYYEKDVAHGLDTLSDLIEPILLMIMAGMVVVLALGVFVPMWDMVSLLGKPSI